MGGAGFLGAGASGRESQTESRHHGDDRPHAVPNRSTTRLQGQGASSHHCNLVPQERFRRGQRTPRTV
eukprot:5982130-Amphidinium_carterae.1